MELDAALTKAFAGEDRLNHGDEFVRNASVVVRLVRNAVAHNVLDPVWKVDRQLRGKRFSIEGVLDFDSGDLHGKRLNRWDFGDRSRCSGSRSGSSSISSDALSRSRATASIRVFHQPATGHPF